MYTYTPLSEATDTTRLPFRWHHTQKQAGSGNPWWGASAEFPPGGHRRISLRRFWIDKLEPQRKCETFEHFTSLAKRALEAFPSPSAILSSSPQAAGYITEINRVPLPLGCKSKVFVVFFSFWQKYWYPNLKKKYMCLAAKVKILCLGEITKETKD